MEIKIKYLNSRLEHLEFPISPISQYIGDILTLITMNSTEAAQLAFSIEIACCILLMILITNSQLINDIWPS